MFLNVHCIKGEDQVLRTINRNELAKQKERDRVNPSGSF